MIQLHISNDDDAYAPTSSSQYLPLNHNMKRQSNSFSNLQRPMQYKTPFRQVEGQATFAGQMHLSYSMTSNQATKVQVPNYNNNPAVMLGRSDDTALRTTNDTGAYTKPTNQRSQNFRSFQDDSRPFFSLAIQQ